jgi:two-component sensor histidine kinase
MRAGLDRRQRGRLLAAAIFLLIGGLAAILGIAYAGNYELAALVDEERTAFERNISEQSGALDRVVFAVAEYLILAARPAADPAELAEAARATLNHAAVVPAVDPAFLAGILGEDPLFLAERMDESNRRYNSRIAELAALMAREDAEDSAEARNAIADAEQAFFAELQERSRLLVQAAGAYHAANNLKLERLHFRSHRNLLEMLGLIGLLAVAAVVFIRSRLAAERELESHRDHLAELVAERTAELSAANAGLADALAARDILIKEVYHRVKNNLTMVAGLVDLQRSFTNPESVEAAFDQLGERIRAISLIHEKLYRSADLTSIPVGEYLTELCSSLRASVVASTAAIDFEFAVPGEMRFPPDVLLPLGLVVTELVTNAFKYAFGAQQRGRIRLGLTESDSGWILNLADDGTPPKHPDAILKSRSLGAVLVLSLVDQLGGKLELSLAAGTAYTIAIPKRPAPVMPIR